MTIGDSLFFHYVPWSWFVAGLLIMALELTMPGGVFVWFGLAALSTGLVTLLIPLAWQSQGLVFAAASIALLLVWRQLPRRFEAEAGDPALNQRALRHVGRRFVLTEPIVAGQGRVKIDDTVWGVAGPDCPAGTNVVVTGVDGSQLAVTPSS